jgi:hypothetical protein
MAYSYYQRKKPQKMIPKNKKYANEHPRGKKPSEEKKVKLARAGTNGTSKSVDTTTILESLAIGTFGKELIDLNQGEYDHIYKFMIKDYKLKD